MALVESQQDELYGEAIDAYGPALERLARSYEFDPDRRRDLLQELHLALWRSFSSFARQCSIRTWLFRVAHNVAATHITSNRRSKRIPLIGLDEITSLPSADDHAADYDRRSALEKLHGLIHRLKPIDREVILLYLEGLDAASIAEVSGISSSNVATKIHRVRKILSERFRQGESNGR